MCFQVCLEWNFTATLKRNAQNTPCEGHQFTPTNSLDKNMGVSLGVRSRFFILFFKLRHPAPPTGWHPAGFRSCPSSRYGDIGYK